MSEYETDVLIWSEHQAQLLRRLAAGEPVNEAPDWPNIAEEIEAVGSSERRELRNRIATILDHLIRLHASPAADPQAGWRSTIREQQRGLRALLEDSPSLRSSVTAVINNELGGARKDAAAFLADYGEQPRVDIAGLDFTEDQVLGL